MNSPICLHSPAAFGSTTIRDNEMIDLEHGSGASTYRVTCKLSAIHHLPVRRRCQNCVTERQHLGWLGLHNPQQHPTVSVATRSWLPRWLTSALDRASLSCVIEQTSSCSCVNTLLLGFQFVLAKSNMSSCCSRSWHSCSHSNLAMENSSVRKSACRKIVLVKVYDVFSHTTSVS